MTSFTTIPACSSSTHEDGSYPGTGKMTDMGEGDGLGATINISSVPGSGDKAVLSVLEEIKRRPPPRDFNRILSS